MRHPLTLMVNVDVRLKFIHLHPIGSLEVLNIKADVKRRGCPSCHREGSINAHGYTRGYLGLSHEREVRRMRFFCSNRGSHLGCGKTFSILWNHLLTRVRGTAAQLLELISLTAKGQTVHSSWQTSSIPISISTAYRWLRKWRLM